MDELALSHKGIIKEAFLGALASGATRLLMRGGKYLVKHPVVAGLGALNVGSTAYDVAGAPSRAGEIQNAGFQRGAMTPSTNM